MKKNYKIGFIGFGNMANAIIQGILHSKIVSVDDLCVYDIDMSKKTQAKEMNISFVESENILYNQSEIIFICVKPQYFQDMAKNISVQNAGKIIVSIMAGKTIEEIQKYFPTSNILRAMPNTPCLVRKGVTAVTKINHVYYALICEIFASIGEVVEIEENQINQIIVASGSAPSYTFIFAKHLIDKCQQIGLSAEMSKKLTLKTIMGACQLAIESDLDLENLCDMVCSKGGTTIEAVKSFNNSHFKDIIFESLEKCHLRAKELSGE